MKRLFRWKERSPGSTSFDQRLVKNTQLRSLPRWSQFKYFTSFLSTIEKRLLLSGTIAITVGVILLLGTILHEHLYRTPQNGGEYSEALIGQPKYINPLFSNLNDTDASIAALIYSGLFRYQGQELVPDLADSYTVSDDKKIYTIKLRPDTHWSDGEPVTASDVAYTFEVIQNPDTGSPLIATFQGIKVEKVDEQTVRFTLKEAFAPFLHSLTVGILPEHVWSAISPTTLRLASNNLEPVGSGAWRFSKLVKDESGTIQRYILTRNDQYYQKKPYLQTLTFAFFNDPASEKKSYDDAAEAVHSQDLSAVSFIPPDTKNKLISSNLITYPLQLPQYTALFFNQTTQPLLKDDNFRLALAEATDKDNIIHQALADSGARIDGPFPSRSVALTTNTPFIKLDLDAANTALDKKWPRIEPEEHFKREQEAALKSHQAELDALKKDASSTPEMITELQQKITTDVSTEIRGQMRADQTFYRRTKDNKNIALVLTTVDTPEYNRVAELIASMWAKIGVQTKIQIVSAHDITREILKSHHYDVLLYGEIVGGDPDPFPFWHSSQIDYPGLNLALYANRSADKLLEDARVTIDEGKRTELYSKFQTTLIKDLPAIFLYTPVHTMVVNKAIHGITVHNLVTPADRFNDSVNWYVKTKWQWK